MGCSVQVENSTSNIIPCHYCEMSADYGEPCYPTCDGTRAVPPHPEMHISYSSVMRMIEAIGLSNWIEQYNSIKEHSYCTFQPSGFEALLRDIQIAITLKALSGVTMPDFDDGPIILSHEQAGLSHLRSFHDVVLYAKSIGEPITWV